MRPLRGVCCPGFEFLGRAELAGGKVAGGVEDSEGGGYKGEDDEGTGAVDAAENDLAEADFEFNGLVMG